MGLTNEEVFSVVDERRKLLNRKILDAGKLLQIWYDTTASSSFSTEEEIGLSAAMFVK